MLKDVIEFVQARTDLARDVALREINYAWKELWNSDDLPNSLFEITVKPIDNNARISLPYYIGELRGVKQNVYGRERIVLHTPRPWYQDDTYAQSPYIWRVLGTSPLNRTITNASTLTLRFDAPVTARTVVTLIGPNDSGNAVREQVTFEFGDEEHETVQRYLDLQTVTKNLITDANLHVIDAEDNEVALVPNDAFEARNTIVQITDKCFKICNFCRCFDVLYKLATPYLYHDETPVPFEEVLMTKTLEWITLPKDGQEKKANLFADKSRALLIQRNGNEVAIEKKADIARSKFETLFSWPDYI